MPVHARARLNRSLPIRPTLVGICTVPLISLMLLWTFAAYASIVNASHAHGYRDTAPQVAPALTGLAVEREQSYVWLTADRRSAEAPLAASRIATDKAVTVARAALNSVLGQFTPLAAVQLNAFYDQLGRLSRIRARIDAGTIAPAAAFAAYDDIVDVAFHFFDATIQSADPTLAQDSAGVTDAEHAEEMTGRELALVGGALAARGRFGADVRALFASTAANRKLLVGDALALLSPDLRQAYAAVNSSAVHQRFATLENQIATSAGAKLPVQPAAWQSAALPYSAALEKIAGVDITMLDSRAATYGDELDRQAYLTGGLGLLAVVTSVVLLVWFGRRVAADLSGLWNSVRGMAEERLPRVVERLQRGEDVDVAEESPPPDAGKITEIARVAEAFATVQAAAVEAAVKQARLRRQVNQIFLNLSMRTQSLLHRQLSMLDAMEQRATDPDDLANLFRLDHLTTRMRRNAEGLIILSGSVPARRWTDSVPVIDVLRAAIGEVEDYTRVDVTGASLHSIAGIAANDVVHLLAELIENATIFSPPDVRIEIRSYPVAGGMAMEVEDHGLGLTSAELTEINQRLASPQEFDLANGQQLGLFIVGQICARHGIQVTLEESASGGVVAVATLPHGVAVRQSGAGARPRPGRTRAAHAPTSDGDVLWGLPSAAAALPAAPLSPEARRNMLASMQQGWQRGRLDPIDDPSEEISR
jgi:signal transduction histidine kinase